MSQGIPLKIAIPEAIRPLLSTLFQIRVPGYIATVVDSGNDWVELATKFQGAIVKLGVNTSEPIRLYPGSTVMFGMAGDLLSIPDLARSKRPKLLKSKQTKAPTRNLKHEKVPTINTGKGLGF